MSKKCTTIYYDKTGKRSKVYYDTEAEFGHEAALEAYTKEMLYNNPDVKYSENITEGQSIKISRKLKKKYTKKTKGGPTISPSAILKETTNDFIPEKFAIPSAVSSFVQAKLKSGEYDRNDKNWAKALEYFGIADSSNMVPTQHVSEFSKYKADILTMWEFSPIAGDTIHLYIQKVIEAYNRDGDENGLAGDYSYDVYEDEIKPYIDAKGRLSTIALNKNVRAQLDVLINKKLIYYKQKLETKYGKVEMIPEAELLSDTLKFNGKALFGKADLVFYMPDTGKIIVIDFKTKSEKSYQNFENQDAPKMSGPFSRVPDDALSRTSIQLGLYGAMAEESYGGVDVETYILPILTEFAGTKKSELGSKKWRVSNLLPENSNLIAPTDLSGPINEALERKEKKSLGTIGVDSVIDNIYEDKFVITVASETAFMTKETPNIKETSDGDYTWRSPFTKKIEKAISLKDIKEKMKESFKIFINMKKSAGADFVSFFEKGTPVAGSIWESPANGKRAANIFNGLSPDTHIMYSASNISALEGIGDDVIVIQDRTTKEISLLSLVGAYNTSYDFHEEGQPAKTTIFGPFLTDKAVTSKFKGKEAPKATIHNINFIRLAMVAAELKNRDSNRFSRVNKLMSVSLLSDATVSYEYSEMAPQLGILKELHNIMIDAEADIPTELETIVKDKDLSDQVNYEHDYLISFFNIVRSIKDPLAKLSGVTTSGKIARNSLLKAMDEVDSGNADLSNDTKLEDALAEYLKQTFWAIKASKSSATTLEAIYTDPDYININRAFLSYKGIMLTKNPTYKRGIMQGFTSLTQSDDPYAEAIHNIINIHEQQARDEVTAIIQEHSRLQQALMDESTTINIVDRRLTKDTYKKLYQDMLLDGYEFDSKNVDIWMRFKNPENSKYNLTENQKNYIRFFNKNVKKAAKSLHHKSTYNIMYPEDSNLTPTIEKWGDGYIPIVMSSISEAFNETISLRGGAGNTTDMLMDSLKKMGTIVRRLGKPSKNTPDSIEDPWELSSMFIDQADATEGRGSTKTRDLLRITDDNQVIDEERSIELNPAVILNMMVLDSARKNNLQNAALASTAIQAELAFKNLSPGVNAQPTIDLVNNVTKLRVHNTVDDEDNAVSQGLDIVKKGSSLFVFFGSMRQFVTEFYTATGQTGASFFGTMFNNILFKKENKYNPKDLLWAATKAEKAFGHQIMVDFGLFNSSLGAFADSEYVRSKANSLRQTKIGFEHIQRVLRTGTQNIILAQMHKEGITEDTYILDSETGRYTYDETKDNRFFVYLEGDTTTFPEHQVAPKTDEEKSRHALWKAHRIKLSKEKAVTKEGRMTRPFIMPHLQAMKHYAIRLFGAMDASQVLGAETAAIGRALAVFRKYLPQKHHNAMSKTHNSLKEGAWINIKNPVTGEYETDFVEQEFEGLVDSIWGFVRDAKRESIGVAVENMSNRRAENITKFMGSLLMYTILALNAALFNKLRKMLQEYYKEKHAKKGVSKGVTTPEGSVKEMITGLFSGKNIILTEAERGALNASYDMLPLIAFTGLLTDSPMAGVSVMYNAATNLVMSMVHTVTGDLDLAVKSSDQFASTSGMYRVGKGIVQIITDLMK